MHFALFVSVFLFFIILRKDLLHFSDSFIHNFSDIFMYDESRAAICRSMALIDQDQILAVEVFDKTGGRIDDQGRASYDKRICL